MLSSLPIQVKRAAVADAVDDSAESAIITLLVAANCFCLPVLLLLLLLICRGRMNVLLLLLLLNVLLQLLRSRLIR